MDEARDPPLPSPSKSVAIEAEDRRGHKMKLLAMRKRESNIKM